MSTTDRKPELSVPRFSQEDWDDVSDNPELTEDELAQLRPASEMPKHIFEALPKRGPGRPRAEMPKIHVKLRVDPAVVEAYKAGGPGWQSRMHEALVRGVEPERKRPVRRRSASGEA